MKKFLVIPVLMILAAFSACTTSPEGGPVNTSSAADLSSLPVVSSSSLSSPGSSSLNNSVSSPSSESSVSSSESSSVISTPYSLEFNLTADQSSYIVAGGGSSNYSEIIIPAEYNGKPVVAVQNDSFFNYYNLTTLTLADSIVEIQPNAFQGCTNLKTVNFSANLTNIGSASFGLCTGLTNLDFPASLKFIGSFAFSMCGGLNWVKLHSGTPPVIESSNFNYTTNIILIPSANLGDYQSDSGWTVYMSRFVTY